MSSSSSYLAAVQELYVTYFGRPADPYGLQNFAAALAAANAPTSLIGLYDSYGSNAAVKSLVDSFGSSKESATLYGPLDNTANATAFVTAVFQNLFDRAPAQAGLSFWVGAITSGEVSPANAALSIAAGAAANNTAQGVLDTQAIANKVAVAGDYTTALMLESDVGIYSGATPAGLARQVLGTVGAATAAASFTGIAQQGVATLQASFLGGYDVQNLTTGTDSLVGGTGKNIFNAIADNAAGVAAGWPAQTMDESDKVTGAGLSNTLNIYDYGIGGELGQPNSLGFTGLSAINITTGENFVGDFAGWSGLSSLTINEQSAIGIYSATAPAGASFSGTYLFGNMMITGGASVDATTAVATSASSGNTISVSGDNTTKSVSLHGGINANILDANVLGSAPNSIASVTIDHGVNASIASNALTSLTVIGDTLNGVIQVSAVTTDRTDTMTLNGDAGTTIHDSLAGVIDVVTTGAPSTGIALDIQNANLVTFNLGADLTMSPEGSMTNALVDIAASRVVIEGAGALTADFSMLKDGAAFDASHASGVLNLTLLSGDTFVGGTGRDVVTIGNIIASQPNWGFASISGGSAPDNEVIITGDSALGNLSLQNLDNFSEFGVSGQSQGNIDFTKYQGFTSFSADTSMVGFLNVAPGSALSVLGIGANIDFQSIDSTAAKDTLQLTLGSTSEAAYVSSLTVADSTGTGYAALDITTKCVAESFIQLLHDSNLSQLTLSGAGILVFGNWTSASSTANALTLQTSSLSIDNTGSNEGSAIVAMSDNNLQTLSFSGSDSFIIQSLSSTSHSLNVVNTDTGGSTVLIYDTALASATFSNESSSGLITSIGSPDSQSPLQTLTLTGTITSNIYAGQVSGSVTVTASQDDSQVTIVSSDVTPAGAKDSYQLGNGSDAVRLGGGAVGSTQTAQFGDGWIGFSTGSQGQVNVSAGNGSDTIGLTGEYAVMNITLGTGEDTVQTVTGESGSISFGVHQQADAVVLGALGNNASKPGTLLAVTGMNNAGLDTIAFADTAFAVDGALAQITASEVAQAGGNTVQLADWLTTATGKGGVVSQAAHRAYWFQFQGNTYLVETAAANDSGVLNANDSVIELTGTGYTFSHAQASGGILTLHG